MQDAHAFEPTQHGRIYIKKLNGPFLYIDKYTRADTARVSRSLSNAGGSNFMTAGPLLAKDQTIFFTGDPT